MARDPKKLKAARDGYRAKKATEKAAVAAVAAAKNSDAPTEREKLLTRRFKAWEKLREQLAEVRKQQNEKVAAAVASMRACMEDGVTVGDNAKALAKLKAAERAWQKLDEAKAERAEALKAARDDVAAAETRLRELVENVNQLSLFEPEEAGDFDADADADADEDSDD
jgi:hypothetical protein